ncbi:MAG: EamA/RhaT family transporter, partial [Mesorhizobium sp.]
LNLLQIAGMAIATLGVGLATAGRQGKGREGELRN